jgi:chlorobactene glucosyltransferase
VLRGEPLPAGWKGKNFACHQLAARARGDLLVFTDADVRWEPGALAALVAELGCSRADLLTVWPTQITRTWPERLVVPLMAFAVLAYLPAPAVHHLPWPVFAAANGQCLAFRRAAYETVGGHATARGSIIEDMHFARAIKARGLRLRMADGAGLVQARMYRSWREVRDGFAKNILAGHAGSPLLLLVSTLAHWALFVLPFAWLVFALVTGGATLAPLLLFLIGLLVRALTAAATRQRILDAIFLPVSVGLMTAVALRALQWHFGAGPAWKGRTYAKP